MSEKVLNGARAAELWEAVKGYVGEHGGGASADGNPIGTVISFMGTSAPKDYLVCDGAEYSVSEYPQLSALFAEQFGAANHFGGDGETTFSVPDLRNLFLRGYHGEAEEQQSGEIGEKQEATSHPGIIGVQTSRNKAVFSYCSATPASPGINSINEDSVSQPSPRWALLSADGLSPVDASDSEGFKVSYTSRPVNMAVLYCIKAVESAPEAAVEDYDTADGWHVRKWPDGYVELFKTVIVEIPLSSWASWGVLYSANLKSVPFPFPFSLKQKYMENFLYANYENAEEASNLTLLTAIAQSSNFPNGAYMDHTNFYLAYRPTKPTADIKSRFNISVTGRWK